jgi:hypothetical protein
MTLSLIRVTIAKRDGSDAHLVYARLGLRVRVNVGEVCRNRYRSRFGIESSYRQQPCQGRTSTRDRRWLRASV